MLAAGGFKGEKEGWLSKRSEGTMGLKIWQKRYFLLGRASLRYSLRQFGEIRRVYELDYISEVLPGAKPTDLTIQV